jgi:hypothetical protein
MKIQTQDCDLKHQNEFYKIGIAEYSSEFDLKSIGTLRGTLRGQPSKLEITLKRTEVST